MPFLQVGDYPYLPYCYILLQDSSLKHYQLNNDYSEHGIRVENVSIDLEKMMSRKNVVIDQLTQGVSALLKTNKVDLIKGRATTIKKNSIEVIGDNGNQEIEARNIIIATGSSPRNFPGLEIDNEVIFDSEGALEFLTIPKRLVVVGAGVIGLELEYMV